MSLQDKAKKNSDRVAFDGVLVALAMVLSYLEYLIPLTSMIPIPGVKLGLANIAVLFCILKIGYRDGVAVSLTRVVLSSLLFGNITGFFFSLSGAVCSLLFLRFLRKWYPKGISVLGLSLGCAVSHDAGQLFAAALLLSPAVAMSYSAVLIALGIATGTLNGIIVRLLEKEWRHIIK